MGLISLLHNLVTEYKYAKFFSIVGTIFALVYHLIFIVLFKVYDVTPMFYYNFYSVTLFLLILIFGTKQKSFFIPFIFFYTEVVIHMILATYFVGGKAGFNYMIMMIGFMTFFVITEKFKITYVFGFISSVLFSLLEIFSDKFTPVYFVPDNIISFMKNFNLIATAFVLITCFCFFAYLVVHLQQTLQTQVEQKTHQVEEQVSKVLGIQNHIINSLADLVDNRDIDTGEHIQRTSAYVEIITKKALEKNVYGDEINDEYASVVKRAAPLHDIGKIVVPDSVLKKPGKLTDEEFDIMKKHCSEGGRIVDEVIGISEDKEFVRIAQQIAHCHHEKWNGRGYPDGLKEYEIPLSARIMAVADVFDALVSKRCYKEPMPLEKAYSVIEEEAGSHFDPVIVDLFLDSKDEIEIVLEKMNK